MTVMVLEDRREKLKDKGKQQSVNSGPSGGKRGSSVNLKSIAEQVKIKNRVSLD